jgi:tryptophan-rich sensory protein
MKNAIPALATLASAIIGGLATPQGLQSWYQTLEKPSWNPPNAIFGPVWTTLYILIAIAGSIAVRQGVDSKPAPPQAEDEPDMEVPASRQSVRAAMTVFYVQLALNALWSWLFFAWHRVDLALLDIIVLASLIALNVGLFAKLSRKAAIMLVPYLAWVGFASVLNLTIWNLNR